MTFTRFFAVYLSFFHLLIVSFFCAVPSNLDRYAGFIEQNAPSEEIILGEIPTWRDARRLAMQVWDEHSNMQVSSWGIVVYIDEENDMWIVNTLLLPMFIGPVPRIIMQRSDGRVLAVWPG